MKNNLTNFLLILALLLLPLGLAQAKTTKNQSLTHILPEEIVSSNLYKVSEEIIIDGTINGDLVAIAKKITVNGQIDGDLIAISQLIIVNGQVGGNIRAIAGDIFLEGLVGRNVTILADRTELQENSHISWDAYINSRLLEAKGYIEGSLTGVASQALIAGQIDQSLSFKIKPTGTEKNSILLSGANIKGNFNYSAPSAAQINEDSLIQGKTQYTSTNSNNKYNQTREKAWSIIYKIFCALVIGLVLIFIGKKFLPKLLKKSESRVKEIFLYGSALLFITPVIAGLLFFTIIGLPLGLIILVLWLIALYLAKVVMMILLGQIVLKTLFKKKAFNFIIRLIVGVVISYSLFSLPFIGWLISLIFSLVGLGIIYLYAKNQSSNI